MSRKIEVYIFDAIFCVFGNHFSVQPRLGGVVKVLLYDIVFFPSLGTIYSFFSTTPEKRINASI